METCSDTHSAWAKIDHKVVSKSFELLGLGLPSDGAGDLPPLVRVSAAKRADIMKSIDEMINRGAPDSPSSILPLVAPSEGGEPDMHNCDPGEKNDADPAAPTTDAESEPEKDNEKGYRGTDEEL